MVLWIARATTMLSACCKSNCNDLTSHTSNHNDTTICKKDCGVLASCEFDCDDTTGGMSNHNDSADCKSAAMFLQTTKAIVMITRVAKATAMIPQVAEEIAKNS